MNERLVKIIKDLDSAADNLRELLQESKDGCNSLTLLCFINRNNELINDVKNFRLDFGKQK